MAFKTGLLVLALTSASAIAETSVPHMAVFGRWFVACDNVRHCEARGVSEEAQGTDLRLILDAGPAAATMILNAGRTIPGTVQIGDQPFTFGPAWRRSSEGGVSSLTTSTPDEIARLIAASRKAKALTFGTASTVPLNGMSAALLRIDDVQQRAGTPTALAAARGTRGVDGAPGLPAAAPWVPPAPLSNAAALAKSTRIAAATMLKAQECTVEPDDEAYALDATRAVVLLACEMYAYQGSTLVLIVSRNGGPPNPFVPSLPTRDEPMPVLILADFDPKSGMLSTAAKGRGFADCGMRASWIWSAGSFRLVAMAQQPLCGGTAPGDWPILYRTR